MIYTYQLKMKGKCQKDQFINFPSRFTFIVKNVNPLNTIQVKRIHIWYCYSSNELAKKKVTVAALYLTDYIPISLHVFVMQMLNLSSYPISLHVLDMQMLN